MLIDIAFVSLAAILIFFIWKLSKGKNVQTQPAQANIREPEQRPQARTWQRAVDNNQQGSEQSGEQQGKEDEQLSQEQMKRKVRKEQKAREKKARQEYIKEQIEMADSKNQKYRERQEEMERQEEEKKRKEEEYFKKIQEDDRKKKEEEYNKWKDFFVVESEGKDRKTPQQEEEEKRQFNLKFLNYIVDNKICLLEDMSNEFRMQTKDIVDKIKQMEAEGQINGVFDERGKYINVTEKQWKAILSYMKAKGRVSKSEMMLECSDIIKLEGLNKQNDGSLLKLIDQEEEQKS